MLSFHVLWIWRASVKFCLCSRFIVGSKNVQCLNIYFEISNSHTCYEKSQQTSSNVECRQKRGVGRAAEQEIANILIDTMRKTYEKGMSFASYRTETNQNLLLRQKWDIFSLHFADIFFFLKKLFITSTQSHQTECMTSVISSSSPFIQQHERWCRQMFEKWFSSSPRFKLFRPMRCMCVLDFNVALWVRSHRSRRLCVWQFADHYRMK